MKIDAETDQLAAYVLKKFRDNKMRITTVESCTGGLIAALLTSIAGSSDVFERGFITYSNAAKTETVGVPQELISEFGAVSSQVAMAMAVGGFENSNAHVSLAITGIAGPDGGSKEKPVGLVYIAINGPQGLFVEELQFGDIGRDEVRSQATIAALEMLVAFGLDEDEEEFPSNIH